MNKNILALGALLILIGMWATGALDKILAGDTLEYLKYFGGVIGTVAGVFLVKYGVQK